MTEPATQELASFAVEAQDLEHADGVWHAGRRTFVNAFGVGVGGAQRSAVERALLALRQLGTAPSSSVLGRGERLSPTWAAFVNALAIHVDDYDDTHLATVVHPGAPVVSTAIAAGEVVGASGRELLEAVIVGVEVAIRVGLGLGTAHFDRGWHLTGTAGHFGAAAAAGRLFGLNAEQMSCALGIAATQAAGLQAALGTMTKPLHPGKAAANAVEAALLARRGFTGPITGIEGRRGFAQAASPRPDYSAMLSGLGTMWHTEANTFKPYACGIVSHPAIDAAIALHHDIDHQASVTAATARVNPIVLDVMGIRDPKTGFEAKFSVYHCVAVGLIHGSAGPDQFTTECARGPAVRTLCAKLDVVLDDGFARDKAALEVQFEDGHTHSHQVAHARGSEARPLNDEELARKATDAACSVLGDRVAAECIELAFAVDSLPTLTELLDAATPQAVGR